MESIVIFFCLQLGIICLRKFKSYKKSNKNYMILAWALLFISFSFTLTIYTITDFFIYDMDLRSQIILIGYISITLGSLTFAYNAEKEMKSKYHIFTLIILVFFILLIIDIFLNFIDKSLITQPSIIPVFIVLLFYVNKFTAPIRKKWKINVYGFIIGVVISILGFAGSADMILQIWIGFRLIGDLLILIGVSLISFFFLGLPSLAEVEWLSELKNAHLFIMHKSGICIYDYSFKEDVNTELKSEEKSQIIAGGLTGIMQILQNMVQSNENLEIIDYGNRKLLFEYGNHIIMVLLIDEKLKILQSKLQELITIIENEFSDYFKSWSGEILQFSILDKMIKQIFKM
ncbi:MAG: hypothetical protein ACTSPY_06375 [Candidatus Helarchaeota archaeon]